MRVIRADAMEFVPASHEDPRNPGVLKKILARRDELFAGRVQMVNWSLLPVGSSFQPHLHEDMEEIFVIVSGRAEIQVDDYKAILGRGDAVVVSPGEIHQMSSVGDVDVEYLVVGIAGEKNGRTVLVGQG
jgi:mannose-6-phosphate isomerase-like protein (cupin superfamily)